MKALKTKSPATSCAIFDPNRVSATTVEPCTLALGGRFYGQLNQKTCNQEAESMPVSLSTLPVAEVVDRELEEELIIEVGLLLD